MARYYFHIKDGAQLIKDEEGSEHATADEAGVQAPKTARELGPTPSRPADHWALMPL